MRSLPSFSPPAPQRPRTALPPEPTLPAPLTAGKGISFALSNRLQAARPPDWAASDAFSWLDVPPSFCVVSAAPPCRALCRLHPTHPRPTRSE
jgi:hypothetical protein